MPKYYDDGDDPDAPQERDLVEDDDADEYTLRCANCGMSVYEDAEFCPRCGQYILGESAAAERGRGWFWPIMVAVLIAMILVFWHGLGR